MTIRYHSSGRLPFALMLLLTATLVSCDILDEASDALRTEVTAEATADNLQPGVGVETTLDARASRSSDGSTLTYNWTVDGPAESSATIGSPSSAITTFTPDVRGDFTITLTVSANDQTDTSTLVLEAGSAAVIISSNISDDTTLRAENEYRVTNSITVSNATLTIEPGTHIRFDEGAGITFNTGGLINADGTEDAPIIMTGSQETPGWWRGLHFRSSTSINNLMNWVVVEYAGDVLEAGIMIGDTSTGLQGTLNLTNSTVRHSSTYGLWYSFDSQLRTSSNNTYINNNSGPAATYINVLHYLDPDSDYTGNNGNDHVRVFNRNYSDTDAHWRNLNVPYMISGTGRITDSDITIEAGTDFLFMEDSILEFGSGANINAVGSEDNLITFKGSQTTPGWWRGIFFYNSRSINNTLEYIVVEDAGRNQNGAITVGTTSTALWGAVQLRNSTIRNSSSYGLWVSFDSELRNFASNTITANASGPVFTHSTVMDFLDGDSDFTGNQNNNDFVFVEGRVASNRNQDLKALNVPYRMSGITRISDVIITFEAGSRFEFLQEAEMRFDGGSGIRVNGTQANPVVFTGTQNTSGLWNGLNLVNTRDPLNVINYAEFSYGGRNVPGMLSIGAPSTAFYSTIAVNNSTFRFSSGVGLHVSRDSDVNADICQNNTFENNTGDGCVVLD